MRRNSVSYYALAREADISTSTLHALMAGKTRPYLYTVYKICNALDISILDLMVEDEDGAVKTGLEPRGKNADLAIPEVFRIEETDAGSLYGHADTV